MKNLDQLIAGKITSLLSQPQLSNDMVIALTPLWNRQEADSPQGGRFKWAHLTLASCEVVSGVAEGALPGAVAMELYALAADIFDDIQDQDNKHLPWCQIPPGQGITMATCLLVLSYNSLSSWSDNKKFIDVIQVLNETGLNACDGQYQEHLNENMEDITLEQYLKMTEKKSGSLTGCACKIGAILAEAPSEMVEKLGLFGVNLGVIAQIENDLKDIININKKSDFIKKKKTLPFIYLTKTLQGYKADEFETLLSIASTDIQRFGTNEKEKLNRMVFEEGAAHYCFVVQEMLRQKAMEIIEQIAVPDRQKGKLINLVRENC